MKSYQIRNYGEPLIEKNFPTPVPDGKEVLVKVGGCGVCHSDVHILKGYFDLGGGRKADLSRSHKLPITLGHEIAGTVAAVGPYANIPVEEKVVVYPWIGCGGCDICKSGEENLCSQPQNLGIHRNGGYATHVIVPDARYLFPIGDLSMNIAATYACSGITAFGALKKVQAKAEGRNLLIIGAGGVGLAALMIAQAIMDTTIIVADIDPLKRKASLAAGADHAVDPTDEQARKLVYKLSGGGIQAAVDFVGSNKTVKFGFGALGTAGHLAIVGLFGGAAQLSIPMFPLKSLNVMGSYVGTPSQFAELMELVSTGKIASLPVASRPLSEAQSALDDLAAGRVLGRVVLNP